MFLSISTTHRPATELGFLLLKTPGADLVRGLFAPLGYAITVEPTPLNQVHADWGKSPYTNGPDR
jgi:hypothetical protein